MASSKEYAYQIKGTKLSLVEKDYTGSADGLNYTYDPDDGISLPSGTNLYKSPLTTVSSGLEIEYVYSPIDGLNNEGDTIDLPSYLSKALVYYVKARIAEDMMDLEKKEYFMREFRRMVEKHGNAQVPGPRKVMPGPFAIR